LKESRYVYATNAMRRYAVRFPGSSVFDVGAGDGRMQQDVEKAGLKWHGFDLDPQASAIRRWDLSAPLPAAEKASMVLMLDVIEHMVNPGLSLCNVAHAMNPGAILILTAPNPRWSRSRVHALLHGYPTCFTESDLDNNGHVFTPWPHVMVKLLHDAGFAIEEYVTLDGRTGWPWPPSSLSYPLRLTHAMINKAIEWSDASACGMSFGMLARRSEYD
jgi:hypothetical protein